MHKQFNKEGFSLVVPTFNRQDMLRGLLNSLGNLRVPKDISFEILIIDNNSTDRTRDVVYEFIEKRHLNIRYIHEKEQGTSFARNRGIREARGTLIGFLDDDEIVDKNWLEAIINGFKQFQCDGISGKTIAKWPFKPPEWYTTEGPLRIIGSTSGHNLGDASMEYSAEIRMPTTANLAIKKDIFNRFGYFRTDLGPVHNDYNVGEDTEFCFRIIKHGARIFYVPEAIVYNLVHRERATVQFCKKYYFRIGRSMSMFISPKINTLTISGIPIYLFREYIENLLALTKSILKNSRKEAFYYRFENIRIAGKVYQLLLNRMKGNVNKINAN